MDLIANNERPEEFDAFHEWSGDVRLLALRLKIFGLSGICLVAHWNSYKNQHSCG